MAANIAARRAAKALRRKVIVAEKRKVEAVAGSRVGRISAAARTPIRQCLLQEGLLGMGTLVLIRGTSSVHVTAGFFLIDTFALGVKDVFFQSLDAEDIEMMLDRLDSVSPVCPIDPASARKLLRDLTAWAKSAGFSPHPDFAVVEKLFGDVDPSASTEEFEFGLEGKALYIPGPSETSSDVLDRLEIIEEVGAHYLIPV